MKIEVSPRYRQLKGFIRKIPELFGEGGTMIYDSRNVIKIFEEQDMLICVKSFRIPFFLNQIIYGFFRMSKAQRSFEYALRLKRKGINTPDPIAYIENKKFGLLKKSYYICVYQPHDGMMRELLTGPLKGRETMLSTFARFTASMHEQKIFHEDYSPGNILYQKTDNRYTFYVIDVNRMSFGNVRIKKGCTCFRRLWGNDEMIAYIAKAYSKERDFNRDECITLTLKYHAAFWKKYTKRYPDRKAYIEGSV